MIVNSPLWIPVGDPLSLNWRPPAWSVDLEKVLRNHPACLGSETFYYPPLCDGHPAGRHLHHPCNLPPEWWSPYHQQSFCEQHIAVNGKMLYMLDWIRFRNLQFLHFKGIDFEYFIP